MSSDLLPLASARQLLKRLRTLGGGATVRRKAAARALLALPPEEGAALLAAVLALVQAEEPSARDGLRFLSEALAHETGVAARASGWRAVAMRRAWTELLAFLEEGLPRREYTLGAAARADARAFGESLGHLKTKARLTRDPAELERLATLSEASVVQNALRNPRLTEAIVVRMAARRPARPEPLREIFASRWGIHAAVRRALVLNPYTPLELAAKVLPLLGRLDWEDVSRDSAVHAALKAQAAGLLGEADAAERVEVPRQVPPKLRVLRGGRG